jgi:hypothetical protein
LALFLALPAPVSADSLDLDMNGKIDARDLILALTSGLPIPGASNILYDFADEWSLEMGGPTATQTPTPSSTETQLATPTNTPTEVSGVTFDFKDYFPLTAMSTWYYVGFNGGSTDDNFRWTVQDTTQDVGNSKTAAKFLTQTDQPTDDRNNDIDFWRMEANGDVLYYGLHLGSDHSFGIATVPSQDIVLTDPLLVGTNGLVVGTTVTDTGTGSVLVNTPFGPTTLPGSFTANFQFTNFIDSLATPLGTFTHVLRVVVNIDAFVSSFHFSVYGSTFFLKEGVGMIAQDQTPDTNDAQLQGIDSGTVYVSGSPVPIVAN